LLTYLPFLHIFGGQDPQSSGSTPRIYIQGSRPPVLRIYALVSEMMMMMMMMMMMPVLTA